MIELGLALLGLGNVAQAFLKLLPQKISHFSNSNIALKFVGVATRSRGAAIDPAGIAPDRLLDTIRQGESLEKLNAGQPIVDTIDFLRRVEADVLIECITLNPNSGQPAVDYIATGLRRGLHVITVNKSGPAFAFHQLASLARQQRKAFLFEGTVLDGAPVFNLVRHTLPACQITGFQGILNSTSNFILTAMEKGVAAKDALRQAQALGIAEEEPMYDLEGWDTAAKTAILINALMNGDITPLEISRTGIQSHTPRTISEANRQGHRLKLLSEARWENGSIIARVAPRPLPLTNPLAHVNGTAAALTLHTDVLGPVTIKLDQGELHQTAYAILADLNAITSTYYASR